MATTRSIEVQCDGAIAWVRFNRPQVLNALNRDALNELHAALLTVSNDSRVRVVVLAGVGRAFCVGGDLKEVLSELDEGTPDSDSVGFAVSVWDALRSCPKPVVAAVQGYATAGGFELLLFCDVIFASETALMGDAHAKYGLLPGGGGAAVLPRRIGINRAKALLFSGDLLPAATLKEWGLVHEVVPDDELERAVSDYACALAERSPLVIRAMKEVSNQSLEGTEQAALHHEMQVLRQHMKSGDFREGLAAFTSKRKPRFEGR